MKEQKLVGITEAAQILGVHPNTLRKWADEGLVPYIKLPSGHRRFSVAEMIEVRESMHVEGDMGKAAA